MLLLMRKRIGSFIIKVFAFFLILGFGAWGIQDMMGYQVGGRSNDVAEVGGEVIPSRALYGDVYGELNRMRQFLGNSFGLEEARKMGLINSVLQQQINAAALRIGADELGIKISDRLVRDAIVKAPMFKGLAENFDRDRFQQILQSNGFTEESYVERLRHDLMRRQLVETLYSGLLAPGRWVDKLYRYQEQTRDLDTVFVSDAAIADTVSANDSDLRQYYRENEKSFTAPSYRAVTFVRLEASELAKEIEIPDDALRIFYDERLDEFTTLERRNVRQIIFADEMKAQEAAKQITGGMDFLSVAKNLAGQDKLAVELGEVTQNDLLPDISGPVFRLSKGAVSRPISTSLGWHLMQVVNITPGGTKKFERVKTQIQKRVALQKAVDAIFDLSNRFEDELGAGASITEAASRLGLSAERLYAIDRAGNDANGVAVPNLPGGDFLSTAFTTKEGEDSAMMEVGNDGFYILNVEKITEPVLRPFETVKNEVESAWKAHKRRQGSQALAESIVEAIKSGKKLVDGISGWNVEIKPIRDVRRRGNQNSEIDDNLAAKVFKLQTGEAAMGRVGDGVRVAVLKRIKPAPSGPTESRKNLEEQLLQSLRQDLNAQLVSALRNDAGVTINQPAVDALFGESQSRNAK